MSARAVTLFFLRIVLSETLNRIIDMKFAGLILFLMSLCSCMAQNNAPDIAPVQHTQKDTVASGETDSIKVDLTGRSLQQVSQPVGQKDGFVAVIVWVDRQGNVVKAESGAIGTTLTDAAIWKECEQQALKAKFSAQTEAPELQKGTIIFQFIKSE